MSVKIAVVTGTRAEFGIWRSVLRGIEGSRKLRLQLVVTGMHLQREFGGTVKDVEAAGFGIAARVPMYRGGESAAESLARGTAGMARAFKKLRPELVMVLGDRLEILAAASAALALQIPIAHVHGGETAPGQWDEQIRHAVTKMAQLHFCATKRAGQRIVQMGEDRRSVHVVGAPALDLAVRVAKADGRGKDDVDPLIVLHPSSSDDALEYRRAKMLIGVVHDFFKKRGQRVAVLGPNNDPGHRGILRAYRELGEKVSLTMSVSQDVFWGAMARAGLLIGNSSSGILEAATFGVAVVNLGDRQAGRERSGNVIDAAWEEEAIRRALKKATADGAFLKRVGSRQNVYGDGRAAKRIVRILESMRYPIPVTKRFYDC